MCEGKKKDLEIKAYLNCVQNFEKAGVQCLEYGAFSSVTFVARVKSRKHECSLCEFAMKTHFCRVFAYFFHFLSLTPARLPLAHSLRHFFRLRVVFLSFGATSFEKVFLCAATIYLFSCCVCLALFVRRGSSFFFAIFLLLPFISIVSISFSSSTVSVFPNFIPFATLSTSLILVII